MANDKKSNKPLTISKREFLEAFAAIGGVSAVLSALDGWGMGIASAADTPPELMGRAGGTNVLILGAGLSGMTAAYELTQRGYSCRILEARPYAGGRCQTSIIQCFTMSVSSAFPWKLWSKKMTWVI